MHLSSLDFDISVARASSEYLASEMELKLLQKNMLKDSQNIMIQFSLKQFQLLVC